MIEAINLSKTYKIYSGKFYKREYTEKEAVHDVSIRIDKGKIIGLLGINGAGKTTTIKMLTTMISPTKGNINIDEVDAIKDHYKAKRKINMIVGGERNIYWRLTARENLEYFGALYGLSKKEVDTKIDEILKIVDLDDVKNVPVEKYSKGMKQRLQIARGLINNPDYLFLDEPTLGLDVLIAKQVHDYIIKLAREENKGLLITTHYINEAEILCDYIYVIHEGRIVAQGTPNEIKNLYTEKKKYKIIVNYWEENKLECLKKISPPGVDIICDAEEMNLIVQGNELDISKIDDLLTRSGIIVKTIELQKISLEEALIEIIERGNEDDKSA